MADLGVPGQHGVNDPSQQADYSLGAAAADDAPDNGETTGKKRKFQNAGVGPGGGGEDDDEDDEKGGRERRKIDIKFIQDKSRRHITFSKRKAGIMKKAYELSVLTGTQVLLLVVSETGLVYTFTTPKLQPLVTKPEGKNLIQACLNAPSPTSENANGLDETTVDSPPEDTAVHQQQQQQHQQQQQQQQVPASMPNYPAMSPQDHMAYQNYLQQQQAAQVGGNGMSPQGISPQGYPVPPQARMGQHPGQH